MEQDVDWDWWNADGMDMGMGSEFGLLSVSSLIPFIKDGGEEFEEEPPGQKATIWNSKMMHQACSRFSQPSCATSGTHRPTEHHIGARQARNMEMK